MSRVTPFPIEAWNRLDAAHPAPTFQARPAWAHALAIAYRDYEPAPMRCTSDDGASCVVPLVRSRSVVPWGVYAGTPLGGYTTPIGEDGSPVESARGAAAMRELLRRCGASVAITPWPLASGDEEDLCGQPIAHETSVVDLRDGAEAALAAMDGKFRRMAGQAERRGVSCERASGSGAVDRYYAMLEESAVRWGRSAPTFPKALLSALASSGADVEIWFARFDGEAIAGGVMLYGADEANFWSAAMRAEFGTLRPSNALNVALIRAAAERGVRWYNLGSSEGLPGVARFKEGLGARTVGYRTWVRESAIYRWYRGMRGKPRHRDRE